MRFLELIFLLFTSLAHFALSFVPQRPFGGKVTRWQHALMDGSGSGGDSVIERCQQKICASLDIPLDMCVIQSADDDPNGTHICVECVSDKFEGKRSMQRQQMVYKALWDEMKDGAAVHAVDGMILKTPAELVKERGY